MEIGMLWFDDSASGLKEKVSRAVSHYESKYGRRATVCLAHPDTLNGGEGLVAGVELRAARSVMPNHYWIGVEDEQRSEARPQKAAA
jgi:hypothetical protein